ncbi:MAG: hypothetical protein Q4G39_08705, partial [Brachymonas sp.]|nr:hypothetical protein [Brachymonas sp.]
FIKWKPTVLYAAMALALDLRLRKPGVYTLHEPGQPAQARHVPQAVKRAGKSVLLAMVLLGLPVLGSFVFYRGM